MVQLVLTLDDNGKLGVNGPIQNKIFVLGMLELAKEAICEYHKQQAQRVQPPTAEDLAIISQN